MDSQVVTSLTAALGAETPVEAIERRAAASAVRSYYDRIFLMKLMMTGDIEGVASYSSGFFNVGSSGSRCEIPEYPQIVPPIGDVGIQNHALVSSRINIQAIAYSDPDFRIVHSDADMREINRAWILKRWNDGGWSDKFFETGMEVESCGIGFGQVGTDEYGRVNVAPKDPLNVMWDQGSRSPSDWRYYFVRDYLDIDQAVELYGHAITRDRLEGLSKAPQTYTDSSFFGAGEESGTQKYLKVWTYWSKTECCIFLGSISGDREILCYGPDKKLIKSDGPGPNPLGIIPIVPWVDVWTPGVKQPQGKAETTWRTVAMLAYVEEYIKKIITTSIPLNLISTFFLDPNDIARIRDNGGLDQIGNDILVNSADPAKALTRVPAEAIPPGLMMYRAMLKEELATVTGVNDAKRGIDSPGEKTAYEVRSTNQESGVQARHTRKQYAKFVEQIVRVARWVGASYDVAPDQLALSDITLDTSLLPGGISPFLSVPLEVRVVESSLQFETDEQRSVRRIQQLQMVDLPAIANGVGDKFALFEDVYKTIGTRDPSRLLLDPSLAQAVAPGGMPPEAMAAQDDLFAG